MDSAVYKLWFHIELLDVPEGPDFCGSERSPLSIKVENSPDAAVIVVSGAPIQAPLTTVLGTSQGCQGAPAMTLKANAKNAPNTPGEN